MQKLLFVPLCIRYLCNIWSRYQYESLFSECVLLSFLIVWKMQDDDAVNAEAFINKASFLVSNSHHEVLNLQYKVWLFTNYNHYYVKFANWVFILSACYLSSSCQVCYARILDLKRKFLEAALRYYDISQIEKRQIGDEYVIFNFIYSAQHFLFLYVKYFRRFQK